MVLFVWRKLLRKGWIDCLETEACNGHYYEANVNRFISVNIYPGNQQTFYRG